MILLTINNFTLFIFTIVFVLLVVLAVMLSAALEPKKLKHLTTYKTDYERRFIIRRDWILEKRAKRIQRELI